MPEPIRLKNCLSCGTSIPEAAVACPECGAPQPRGESSGGSAAAGRGPGPGPGSAPGPGPDPFDLLGSILGGRPPPKRTLMGLALGPVLSRSLGCLVPGLIVIFGIPLLVGLLAGNVLGALGVMLLGVGVAGLVATLVLVWVLWPLRRGGPRPRS